MKFPQKKTKLISNYYKDYVSNLFDSLSLIKFNNLELSHKLIEKTIKNKNNIFVCGNGGSASISNHIVCDYLKLLRQKTILKPKVISFATNLDLISAISNDISFEDVFAYQLEALGEKNDLIILISSSGNSPNMIKVLNLAKKKKIKSIAFTGFDGGFLKSNSDISIHFASQNYGISEDCHHISMHVIMQFLRQKYLKGNIKKINF